MAKNATTHVPHCDANRKDFFDSILPLVRPLAIRLDTDENYLLALVAFEDSWGQDVHNKKLHNIFGITKAGGNNLAFTSYEACVAFWERNYGPKVKGVKTLEDFITAMKAIGYNSVNKRYYDIFRAVYQSVLKYKIICEIK
jgi:hypothetical protein